jgi:hypothetical protein
VTNSVSSRLSTYDWQKQVFENAGLRFEPITLDASVRMYGQRQGVAGDARIRILMNSGSEIESPLAIHVE